ncbi:hypothetical protein ROS62_25575, partial [Streptomyces sp. DSM 41972]|nr:hypothetical protein [Streptomyces sp. DSM 41972]
MRPAHGLLAVLVAAVWGVNCTVIEVGLGHFPPLLFSALRFLVAALPAVFLVGPPKVARKGIVGADRPEAGEGDVPAVSVHADHAGGEPAGKTRLPLRLEPGDAHPGALPL